MIEVKNKKDCCGCSACAQACAKGCIMMVEDEEGFLYPNIDKDSCVECGLCEKVCPVLNVKPEEKKEQKAFVVQNRDLEVLRQSTSGGAFTAIAQWILSEGGIVCGAAYDGDLTVKHVFVENVESLKKFRNSKYVQSQIGDTFKKTKEYLQSGKKVLYSGTPCQLEGLLTYLRKPYENLWTVDVVCHACPSPLMFRKYKEWQKAKGDDIENIAFRDKHYGYKYSTMSVFRKTSKNYHEGIDTDPYLRAFFQHISVRPSCFACAFKKQYRLTDFTIWDCFDVDRFCKEMDNDRGVTKIMCHTKRAQMAMPNLEKYLKVCEITPEDAVEGEKEIFQSASTCDKRDEFFHDLNTMPVEECFNKYFPLSIRHRLEKQIRLWTNRLGIYKLAKKIFKLINGKKEIKR